MLAIRLRRAGSKKRPSSEWWWLIAGGRDSNFVEIVGTTPRTKPALVQVDKERNRTGSRKGAQRQTWCGTLIARLSRRRRTPREAAAAAEPGQVSTVRDVVEVLARAVDRSPRRGNG